jgi:transcriptional regulator with XRE-family HTH domain
MSVNRLGHAIQKLRTARGLTQEQLAAKTSMAKGSIAQIEQGLRSVSLDSLDRIAEALNVPCGCLVVMGSSPTAKNKSVDQFLVALQNLSVATLEAKSTLQETEQKPVVSSTKARLPLRGRSKKRASRRRQLQQA